MEIPQELIEKIKNLPRPTLIGVSGFGGAGKSTLAEKLGSVLGTTVIGVDSFMLDNKRSDYSQWEIVDFARIEREVLAPFTKGQRIIHYGHFDWSANSVIETKEVNHDGILIVEGVGLFRPELKQYFSFTIWVDCPIEEANERGKRRDRDLYKNPQDAFWDGIWKENDKQYDEQFRPSDSADAVIKNY